MGSRTTVTLFDDVDGSTDDVRTVSLSLNGKTVELELSQTNYDKVTKFLQPYIAAGRKTSAAGSTRPRPSAPAASKSSADTQKMIRAWAADQGIDLSPRGRISSDVVARYEAAQK